MGLTLDEERVTDVQETYGTFSASNDVLYSADNAASNDEGSSHSAAASIRSNERSEVHAFVKERVPGKKTSFSKIFKYLTLICLVALIVWCCLLTVYYKRDRETVQIVAENVETDIEANKVLINRTSQLQHRADEFQLINRVYYPPGSTTYSAPKIFFKYQAIFGGFGYGSGVDVQISSATTLEDCIKGCRRRRDGDIAFNAMHYYYADGSCFCEKNTGMFNIYSGSIFYKYF